MFHFNKHIAISVVSGNKGGTGKTTIAANLAALLPNSVLVDQDSTPFFNEPWEKETFIKDFQTLTMSQLEEKYIQREEGIKVFRSLSSHNYLYAIQDQHTEFLKYLHQRYSFLIQTVPGNTEALRLILPFQHIPLIVINRTSNSFSDIEGFFEDFSKYRNNIKQFYLLLNKVHPDYTRGQLAEKETVDTFLLYDLAKNIQKRLVPTIEFNKLNIQLNRKDRKEHSTYYKKYSNIENYDLHCDILYHIPHDDKIHLANGKKEMFSLIEPETNLAAQTFKRLADYFNKLQQ